MTVKIRLSRNGSKKDPHYSVVVIDSKKKRDGKCIEKVGHYHPCMPSDSPTRIVINAERVILWIKNGAIPTDTVARLMHRLGMEIAAKFYTNPTKSKYDGLSKSEVVEAKKKEQEAIVAEKEAKKLAAQTVATESAMDDENNHNVS